MTRQLRRLRYPHAYRCVECGHRGEQRHADDSHDSEAATCSSCEAPVRPEWDGGVTFETPKTIADEAIERTRSRK